MRRAARHRGSQLHLRRTHRGAPPRHSRAEPRGAAGRRRQPRIRVEADAPPLHRQSDDAEDSADALVPGQQRPGDLRRRRDPRRRDRARRDGMGRRVREAVQQAALRLRPGQGRLVLLDGLGLEAAATCRQITHPHFTGTGTRSINDSGKKAIEALFTKNFESVSASSSFRPLQLVRFTGHLRAPRRRSG